MSESPACLARSSVCHAPDPARQRLHDALLALDAAGNTFALRFIRDSAVRETYRRSIQAAAREITDDVERGVISPETGAQRAVELRNQLMQVARQQSSGLGRAVAENLKAQGKTFPDLIALRAQRLFGKAPEALSEAERTQVMRAIIAGAARDRPSVTGALRFLGPAARGVVALSIGLALYDIYRAPDHAKEAAHQGVLFGAGLGGSAVVGALGTSLVCGPGAPVCAGIFILVGGIAFTAGADFWWHRLEPSE